MSPLLGCPAPYPGAPSTIRTEEGHDRTCVVWQVVLSEKIHEQRAAHCPIQFHLPGDTRLCGHLVSDPVPRYELVGEPFLCAGQVPIEQPLDGRFKVSDEGNRIHAREHTQAAADSRFRWSSAPSSKRPGPFRPARRVLGRAITLAKLATGPHLRGRSCSSSGPLAASRGQLQAPWLHCRGTRSHGQTVAGVAVSGRSRRRRIAALVTAAIAHANGIALSARRPHDFAISPPPSASDHQRRSAACLNDGSRTRPDRRPVLEPEPTAGVSGSRADSVTVGY